MSNRNKEKSFAMNSTNSQVAIDAGDSNETDDDNQVCTLWIVLGWLALYSYKNIRTTI